jgi:pimeloyl-ACP methyl ester carboxylesterase
MVDVVLVPGGFHGGWYFSPILPVIRAAGHIVHAVTLTGLGERRHLSSLATNLDTHIQDVLALIEHERLEDIVLLGHSYAGMVISGVADRLPGKVKCLVYLDALVPDDGDSVFSLLPDAAISVFCAMTRDGMGVPPSPGMDERTSDHPLGSFLQPIRLGGGEKIIPRKMFVWCSRAFRGPFEAIHDRLLDQTDWQVSHVPFGHDIMNESAETVIRLILSASDGTYFDPPLR